VIVINNPPNAANKYITVINHVCVTPVYSNNHGSAQKWVMAKAAIHPNIGINDNRKIALITIDIINTPTTASIDLSYTKYASIA
jgi:hypothetical protein